MNRVVAKNDVISIPAQVAVLRGLFPFGETTFSRSKIRWVGNIIPDEYGRSYKVELIYKLGYPPEVFIREPNLRELAGDRSLPHVYNAEMQQLCLYVPGRGFWSPNKHIALTVMPWACLWCEYFELWLATDVWHGPGEHPTTKKIEN